ncbi:hypothetical protein KEJ51_06890 [Candidatus Bathyarchaeota archaeon]|nr:hypothetical protein [Candidatus Bathyarchaeota archaeon]MBS7629934.1 hypothetical protein [Candidatus Bathyarchaeota archaeon]
MIRLIDMLRWIVNMLRSFIESLSRLAATTHPTQLALIYLSLASTLGYGLSSLGRVAFKILMVVSWTLLILFTVKELLHI